LSPDRRDYASRLLGRTTNGIMSPQPISRYLNQKMAYFRLPLQFSPSEQIGRLRRGSERTGRAWR
jgi:hypothetical protein